MRQCFIYLHFFIIFFIVSYTHADFLDNTLNKTTKNIYDTVNNMDKSIEINSNQDNSSQLLAIADTDKNKKKYTKSADSSKDYDFVYEKCTNQPWANQADCECVATKAVELHLKKHPEQPIENFVNHYFSQVLQKNSCYNVNEIIRRENDLCMGGTLGGKMSRRLGIPKEDYCECLAQTYGKLFREFKGQVGSNGRSSLRRKAMNHCKRSKAYK